MKAVVVGAGGFVGRHVVRALSQAGWEVAPVVRKGTLPADPHPAMREIEGSFEEIRDAAQFARLIVNAAGTPTVGFSFRSPRSDLHSNVSLLAEILEVARLADTLPYVVTISSAAVYGDSGSLPMAESAQPRPASPLGTHKWMAELLGRSYAENFGVDVTAIRLFSVYGAGLRKQLFWDACTRLTAGGNASFFGTGEETRDWLHVEDAAALVARVADLQPKGFQIYNGGTGIETSTRRIVAGLSRHLAHHGGFSFSGEGRPGDPARMVADVERVGAIGWKPRRQLDAGLAEYVAWFAKQPSAAPADA